MGLLAAAGAVALGGIAGSSEAAVYEIAASQETYTAEAGTLLQVPVFLRETVEEGEESIFAGTTPLGDRVLFTFLFDIQPTPDAGAVNPGNTDITDDFITSGGMDIFLGFSSSGTPFGAAGSEYRPDPVDGGGEVAGLTLAGAGPTVVSPGVRQIPLGFFRVDVQNNSATFTLPFSVAEFNFANEFATDPAVLTFEDFTASTFTVIVPEPTSIGLLAGAGLLGLRRRR